MKWTFRETRLYIFFTPPTPKKKTSLKTTTAASSVWVSIAQLGEHCSANAEATGSNPVKASKNLFFSGYFRNCLNCDSLWWPHAHFNGSNSIRYEVNMYLGISVNKSGLGFFEWSKFHFILSLKVDSAIVLLFSVAGIRYILVHPFR